MDSFWKGSFGIVKHVSSVRFIPLTDMGKEDWEVLDFPELRPRARAKITGQISAGRLQGFFRVNYDMHKRSHGGKPTYYYPADDARVDRLGVEEYSGSQFEDFEGYDEEPDEEYTEFDQRYDRARGLPLAGLIGAAGLMRAVITDSRNEEDYYEGYGADTTAIALMSLFYTASREDQNTFAEEMGVEDGDPDSVFDAILEAVEEGNREGVPQD